MPILLFGGLAALIIGVVLFFCWVAAIGILFKALLSLAFITGGVVAIYLGWEEFQDRNKPPLDFSSPDEADRYKAEAHAYQTEINEVSPPEDGGAS